MLFNSIEFLIFFPVVTLLYFAFPHRVRHIWLLIASYFFYMCWNPKYALLMLTSTVITYASGLLISKADAKGNIRLKKIWVAVSFISNLAILFLFKYFDFALENINKLLSVFHISLIQPSFDLLLPVGISFYTFQALSYTMDVYRHDVAPEKNFLKYALFVSFFPQLVAGPIERSSNLIHQISEEHAFDPRRAAGGLCLMAWGFFQKLIIADRAAILVNTVYNQPIADSYTGFIIVIATVLFAFQIYCDFSSYSDIARGAAQVMGFSLMKNFDTPYFSCSVTEFWRRWHISLSTWFRDYLYIPLGGNRKGSFRKRINLMIVFIVSGLWHGASWNYIIWGALNGVYQIAEDLFRSLKKKRAAAQKKPVLLSFVKPFVKPLQMLFTFALINFSWVFFRANGTRRALTFIGNIFRDAHFDVFTDGTILNLGLDFADMSVLLIALCILLLVSIAKYRKFEIREWLFAQRFGFRYFVYFCTVAVLLIFGIYGSNYDASQFIYFQF